MGHVGDKLGPEALAADALVHRLTNGVTQVVELPGVLGQVVVEPLGVDLEAGVAPQNLFCPLPYPAPLDGPPAQQPQHQSLVDGDKH